jgi:uncharacterized protein YrrD
MQDIENIQKWSDIKGMPVVGLKHGEKLGTVEDFYFDPATFYIYALVVQTGPFTSKVLHTADISGLGKNAITTPGANELQDKTQDPRLSTLPQGKDLLSRKIMSAAGNVVGSVGHLLIATNPPNELRITAVELTGGILEHLGLQAPHYISTQEIHYGTDTLIIPDAVAQSLKH